MKADFDLDTDGTVRPSGSGGARFGTGPRPEGHVKPESAQAYDSAKARKEKSLADMHELNYKVKSGEYISRSAVREASATLLSNLAQALRGIPDNLERKFHLSPEIAEEVEKVIDASLADVSDGMAMFTTESIG